MNSNKQFRALIRKEIKSVLKEADEKSLQAEIDAINQKILPLEQKKAELTKKLADVRAANAKK